MNTYLKQFALSLPVATILSLQACSSSNTNNTPVNNDQPGEQTTNNAPSGDSGQAAQPGQPSSSATVALDQVGNQLVQHLAGYSLEEQSEEVLLLAESIVASAGEGAEQSAGSFSVQAFSEPLPTSTERTLFDCPLGGTVMQELGRLRYNESSYSNHADHDQYDFDQCRIEVDGEQVLSGSVRVMSNSISASRGGFANKDVQWSDFSWQQGDSGLIEGTALIEIRSLLSFNNNEVRNVSIAHYEHKQQDKTVLGMDDGVMKLGDSTEANGALRNYSLTVSGTVTDASGVPVRISTQTPVTGKLAFESFPDNAEALSGVLQFAAEDGGSMTLSVQPITFQGPLLADLDYVTASGEQKTLAAREFTMPTINAAN